MYKCKICGEPIDDYQYDNYNHMCSSCIRTEKAQKNRNPITGKIFQLTSEIESRKDNHWAFWMFLWFIVAGFIAVFFLPPLILISVVGIIGTYSMYKYIQKTKDLEDELKSLVK
ncbi:MAG: hypothetical protein CEE42_05725 [Promethearchaeota archaeon Loki_b31]|nr:MAG: hypothetical protein CEE42_05725 [Candidatus Lokiarchaeota archaeon Loki_b31]